MRPKKVCVSTLYLKWILIISELQNTPWPRPANAHQKHGTAGSASIRNSANAHIDFINSSAALSELNCDCRLRIDPSAADAEWTRAGLIRFTASSR